MAGAREMEGLARWAVWCLLLAVAAAQNRARDRVLQSGARPAVRYWNTQMYPKWQGGAAQIKDCWKGGEVTFAATNDGPTLVAAKTTFSIQLNFPHNQTVLPDGQVVWDQNCTVNGTHVVSGEPVYPDAAAPGSDPCVFPDGQRFPPGAERRRSKFVYVWQSLGKYWQVIDGPRSHLTIDTDGVALGSYAMEVVVYHYRGRQQFIPMGQATSQFTITNQVPFSVSISQILDLDEADSRFVQNRAIAFNVQVHDPSQYLRDADISYSWDFGDQSGTLITHGTAVTHTYVSAGSFQPQVVLQAAIPLPACVSTPAGTMDVATTGAPEEPTASEPAGGSTDPAAVTSAASTLAPGTVAPDGTNAPEPTAPTTPASAAGTLEDVTVPAGAAETPPAATVPAGAAETPPAATVPAGAAETPPAATVPAGPAGTPATADVNLDVESVATETAQPPVVVTEDMNLPLESSVAPVEMAETELPAEDSSEPAVAEGTPPVAEVAPAVTVLPESLEEAAAVTTRLPESITEPEATAAPEGEVTSGAALPETAAAVDESLVLVKRQAIENQPNDCLLYRYGSYATNLDIVEGIERVQIVQVVPALAVSGQENAVDFTITCQGSIPSDVCTTVSDPDCLFPVETVCNPVPPSSDCQMVLRQLFNSSGDYCVNVSLTNAVSLAVASAQVHVSGGPSASAGFGAFVGVLVLGLVLVGVAYTYSRHVKRYSPLSDAPAAERSSWRIPDRSSLRLFFRNALGHTLSGESSPLLSGHVV